MTVTFLLNGRVQTVELDTLETTTLNWLRENGFVGTKEGCAEGDCGACTAIMVEWRQGTPKFSPVNTCIQWLARLHGCALITIEGLKDTAVQQAVIDEHGSQCGFCTPGFVMSLVYGQITQPPASRAEALALLAGNLCRCTGYTGLLRVAEKLSDLPVADLSPLYGGLADLTVDPLPCQPESLQDALQAKREQPSTQVVAGNTDVGLWVTKRHDRFADVVMLHKVPELTEVRETEAFIELGAMVTYEEALDILTRAWPSSHRYLERIASTQIRSVGTVGGNIANGSPIGDMPPMLIALNAAITLESTGLARNLPLEEFFLEYGRQDLRETELLTRIRVLKSDRHLHLAKLSKRPEQDISAVSLGMSADIRDGVIVEPIMAFGGMAGTPKRAHTLEQRLNGCALAEALKLSLEELQSDFSPLSDARASSAYRLRAAQGMIRRGLLDWAGQPVEALT